MPTVAGTGRSRPAAAHTADQGELHLTARHDRDDCSGVKAASPRRRRADAPTRGATALALVERVEFPGGQEALCHGAGGVMSIECSPPHANLEPRGADDPTQRVHRG